MKTQQPQNSQSRSQIDKISRSQRSSANTRVFTTCPHPDYKNKKKRNVLIKQFAQSMFMSGKCVLSFNFNFAPIVFLLVKLNESRNENDEMRNSNGSNEFVYILFYWRYVYNSKFLLLLHSLGLARATCVDFLYEFRNVCTKATTSVYLPPPPHPT